MDAIGFTSDQFTRLMFLLGDPVLRKLLLGYCGMAVLGQIAYAGILWYRKEIACVWHRFQQDPRATIAAIGTNMLALLVVALSPDIIVATLTMQAALFNGFMQGIAIDSALNKSRRKLLTDEERATLAARSA